MLDCEESWALKNWCFWTVVLEKTLESPWTARRSNQSILKEISPGCSLEGLMLKLKLQYFGHLMWRVTHWKRLWCWEGLGASGEGDDRGWDGWMASPTRWTWVWVNSGSWWWTERPGVLQFMGSKSQTRLSNWTELNGNYTIIDFSKVTKQKAALFFFLSFSFFFLFLFVFFNFTILYTAAAKSLQSCPTLCDPIDGSLPGSPVTEILQARTLEWVAIFFSNAWKWKVKVKLLSHVGLLVTPWTAA